jgi:hypothetical protein
MKLNILIVVSVLVVLMPACRQKNGAVQTGSVNTAVRTMATNIARDLADKGPKAWLDYFEENPNFFMANEGQRTLPNNEFATRFVKDILSKQIMKVNLMWNNIYVDSLSPTLAMLSAGFHEDLFNKDDQSTPADGYFTGIAEQTPTGWKLRDLHWSSLKK